MLKVYVGDYFLGKAGDVAAADGLVLAHAAWLVSQHDIPDAGDTIAFRYVEAGKGVWTGEMDIRDVRRWHEPVKGA